MFLDVLDAYIYIYIYQAVRNVLILVKPFWIFQTCIPFLCVGDSVWPPRCWGRNFSRLQFSPWQPSLWLPQLPALPSRPLRNRLGQLLQYCLWWAFRCLGSCQIYHPKCLQFYVFICLRIPSPGETFTWLGCTSQVSGSEIISKHGRPRDVGALRLVSLSGINQNQSASIRINQNQSV